MSTRSVVSRITGLYPRMERSTSGCGTTLRYFSDGKGKILSEEEKAAENVYIKKMEREKLEKAKAKAKSEKEKSAAESEKAKSSDEKK